MGDSEKTTRSEEWDAPDWAPERLQFLPIGFATTGTQTEHGIEYVRADVLGTALADCKSAEDRWQALAKQAAADKRIADLARAWFKLSPHDSTSRMRAEEDAAWSRLNDALGEEGE